MIRRAALVLLLPLLGAAAEPEPVRDAAGLARALDAAKGGETIVLQAGDYGRLTLRGRSFATPVTLRGATPGAAKFARIALTDVRGLTFDGIELVHRLAAGESTHTRGIDIRGGGDLAIVNSVIAGTADGDPMNDGHGMHIHGSERIKVERNRFNNLFRGFVTSGTRDISVTDNQLTDMRSDGLNFEGVERVTIERNLCRDFYGNRAVDDHPDCIQFWARSVGPSADVVIRDNVILQGRGGMMQGIFVRSQTGARHRNFRVENNLYHSIMLNGVALGGVDGGTIERNTVISLPGQQQRSAIRIGNSTGIRVANNIACVFVQSADARVELGENLLVNCQGKGTGPAAERVFRGPLGAAATLASFEVDWRAAGLQRDAAGFAPRN